MKERLLHILDQSTCLTRRQMKDYLAGTMLPEEVHAAETHISSCPLCSMALDGFQEHTDEALAAISSLNSGFLKDHFDSISPQIHLNSLAPAIPVAHHSNTAQKKRGNIVPLLKVAAVAAAILVGFGIFWIIGSENAVEDGGMIAQNDVLPPATPSQSASPVNQRKDDIAVEKSSGVVAYEETKIKKESATGTTEEALDDNSVNARQSAYAETKAVTAEDRAATTPAAAPPAMMSKATTADIGNSQKGKQHLLADTVSPGNAKSKPAAKMLAAREAEADKKTAEHSRTEETFDKDVDHLELGNEAFDKGSYQSALNHYKAQMNTGRPKKRAEATFKAAQCYKSLGNKTKAISLLKSLVENDGPYRKSARKLLDEMGVK